MGSPQIALIIQKKLYTRGLPGSPVVEALHSQWQGGGGVGRWQGLTPGRGAGSRVPQLGACMPQLKIPHATMRIPHGATKILRATAETQQSQINQ